MVGIAGISPQSLQFPAQVTLVSLGWIYKSGVCTKSCAAISAFGKMEIPVTSDYAVVAITRLRKEDP
jgi:hypothetical protein